VIFLNSDYLIFMLAPAVLLFYLIVTNKNKLDLVFSEDVLKKIKYDGGGLGRVGRNIMLSLASFFMIMALARPAVEKGEVNVENRSLDILVALDISDSMKAKDIYPNRLSFAKEKFFEFLDLFKEANVGVVAFSSDVFIVSPKTDDFEAIKYLVNNLSIDSISSKGTNFMLPIKAAERILKDSPSKILLIFTDGGDQRDFSKEIEEAKRAKITVYIYAVGTKRGSYIKVGDREVLVRLNESIKDLAKESGGAFVVGSYGEGDLKFLIEDIKEKFKDDLKKSVKKVREYKELFYYPLALAILFMLFAFSSIPKKLKIALFLALFCFDSSFLKAGALDFLKIKKGIESYAKGDYYKSVYYFEEVAKEKKSPESYYDLANAYYRQKSYKKAIENYEKVQTDSKMLNFMRYYNEGNAYFKLKDYDNAIKMYETARKYGEDEDLLFNLELAKKMKRLKKRKETQKKEGKKKNKSDKKREQKSNKGSKKGNKQQNRSDKGKKKGDKKPQNATPSSKKSKSFKNQKSKASLTNREEKKWERLLEKKRAKTLPIEMKIDRKKKIDEKPW